MGVTTIVFLGMFCLFVFLSGYSLWYGADSLQKHRRLRGFISFVFGTVFLVTALGALLGLLFSGACFICQFWEFFCRFCR